MAKDAIAVQGQPTNGDPAEEMLRRVSPKQITSTSRRLRGQIRRKNSLRSKIDDLTVSLDSSSLTTAQRELLKGKIIELEGKLADASRDVYSLNKELKQFVANNNKIARKETRKRKRASRAAKMEKSLTEKTAAIFDNLVTSEDSNVDVDALKSLAVAGDRKEFRTAMDKAIQLTDHDLFVMVTADSTIHTSIIMHVMNLLADESKKLAGTQEVAAPVPVKK